jgi:DNA helicase IV
MSDKNTEIDPNERIHTNIPESTREYIEKETREMDEDIARAARQSGENLEHAINGDVIDIPSPPKDAPEK